MDLGLEQNSDNITDIEVCNKFEWLDRSNIHSNSYQQKVLMRDLGIFLYSLLNIFLCYGLVLHIDPNGIEELGAW